MLCNAPQYGHLMGGSYTAPSVGEMLSHSVYLVLSSFLRNCTSFFGLYRLGEKLHLIVGFRPSAGGRSRPMVDLWLSVLCSSLGAQHQQNHPVPVYDDDPSQQTTRQHAPERYASWAKSHIPRSNAFVHVPITTPEELGPRKSNRPSCFARDFPT